MSEWRFALLGYQAGFARPLYLVLAVGALLLGVAAVLLAVGRRRRVEALLGARLAAPLTPGVSVARPATQGVLGFLGLCLFAVALAQPQCGSHAELTKRRGIDVVVALDASKSMLAQDVKPSRIERARAELNALLDELKGDRVAIVIFAGEAFVQSPLTSDYAAAKIFLRSVDPLQMPQGGTNIGAALELSREVLEGAERGAKERVVVLLSDGEDVTGEVEAAVDALAALNVPIFSVGIGSETGEPIPVFDKEGNSIGFQKDDRGEVVLSRLNRAALEELATKTGGEYFHQERGVAVNAVISRVDGMKKSEMESRVTVRYVERFQRFALPGLLLLVLAFLLPTSARRKA